MTKDNSRDCPNRIRELRKARGLTLAQLAQAVGMTTGHVQKLEVGERELTLPVMERVAGALEVAVADLLPPALGGLTDKERRIVDTYREVPSYLRGAFDGMADSQQQWRGRGEIASFPQDETAKRSA
ncbi:MAG: helix-turn-helix transcriptional regulator [Qipengyuania citrea]|uniref:helix-turn-helix domain-containing protein n=1 Tax=Qipengyuania citrea TaxID=225971 RepID=UPI003264C3F0